MPGRSAETWTSLFQLSHPSLLRAPPMDTNENLKASLTASRRRQCRTLTYYPLENRRTQVGKQGIPTSVNRDAAACF